MTTGRCTNPSVLIIGAGPTGLTLACDLARRGVSYRLIESQPGPQVGSRGKGLQPRSLEVFHDLGIAEQVIANGRFAMPIRQFTPDGASVLGGAEPEELRGRPDIPYTTSLITPEWRIEEALRSRLSRFGGAVEFGTTLIDFEHRDDHVLATVNQAGTSETITATWLVGCDGGHSRVRKASGIEFVGETFEDVQMIVADVVLDGLDREEWRFWSSSEHGLFALCPLPSTKHFQYQASTAAGDRVQIDVHSLQALLEARTGRNDIRLRGIEWSTLWRLNVRLVDRYRDGRVLLAGDAAHIHSPAGGQGMNTGIQDAYNLGWKLAAVTQGASPDLLDTYQTERRPIAAGVIEMSNELSRRVRERDHEWLRRRGSRTIQLGVSYRGTAIARDDRADDDALRAGDRAPDATHLLTVDGERRLFDLTAGTGFTLLSFGPTPTVQSGRFHVETLHVVERPQHAGEVADGEGHLAHAYGATDSTIVLVRPDGYVAVISDSGDPSAVSDYFAAIG